MAASEIFRFDNTYARLPGRFFARLDPTAVAAPRLALNTGLADELGLDADQLTHPDGVAMLAGNRLPTGASPLAMAYAGHQFGNWVPQLGDGRAILLGEVVDPPGPSPRHPIERRRPNAVFAHGRRPGGDWSGAT